MGEPSRKSRVGLVCVAVGAAAVWLTALPWLASTPGFMERRADLAERGVDPTAVFYTDHPGVFGPETASAEGR